MPLNFAVIGAAGYIAPRHFRAIRDTGNKLVAAVDPHEAVGVLDQYSFDVRFFNEIERFDRHLEKLRRGAEAERVHFVSICSPNYLHDAHCRLALRVGANVICEKPLVINPWNLGPLQQLEAETGRRIFTVLQLRVHPALLELRRTIQSTSRRHQVTLTYVTARGPWYHVSWKGAADKSGGVTTNIGVHLFDLLLWLFGSVHECHVHRCDDRVASGCLELERAQIRWFLSLDTAHLPFTLTPGGKTTYRSITIDDNEVEFTEGFADLHTRVYEEVLAGRGFSSEDARPAIELTHRIRTSAIVTPDQRSHPYLTGVAASA